MHYTVGHPFYFGGTNADGSSAINELSYWILEEYNDMNILDPKLHIKVSENTPQDFIDYALNMIRSGRNSIVFVGEPCIIRTMTKHGYSLQEARTADIKGCYEYCVRGGCVETAPFTLNVVKILGLALHNGIEVLSGKRQGPETGDVSQFTSFRQFYRAFMRQLFYQLDRNLKYALRLEEHLDECTPAPMISGTFESSLRRAVDGYARGAKYNNTNVWICGTATTADSLAMIKRWCFDRKKFTLPALVEMLDRDFEGDEIIRQQLLNDPEKYGNNQTLPDRLAVHFASAVAKRINGKPNSRGGIITVALHASNRFFQWADCCEATADGRKRGDELSKNMSAGQGNAISGATSLVASVLKFDSSLFMADLPVDIMLHPSEVKGDAGLAAMRSLLMTYIKNYGHAMHFNVMDASILRDAQKNPEKYRDLQVRICGWNVYWNSISKREQDAYIRQAEKL
jgi:formate C-acetyltransferase